MICERCGGQADINTTSFFNTEIICLLCENDESDLLKIMKITCKDINDYNGCGYVPSYEDIFTREKL